MTTISSNLIQQNILEYIIRIENQRQKMYTKRKVLIRTGTGKKSNGRVKQAGSSTSTPFISPKYIIWCVLFCWFWKNDISLHPKNSSEQSSVYTGDYFANKMKDIETIHIFYSYVLW